MALYNPAGRLVWSLTQSSLGTTLTGAGNSGGWSASPNARTPVDLRDTVDVTVYVNVAGPVTGTSPTLNVQLDAYDANGNPVAQVAKLAAALTAAGAGWFSAGLHSSQLVLPQWGRIAWTVGGTSPNFTGVEISVFGR